jgi:hypothetical protein
MEENLIVSKGEIIVLTSGEYSEYGIEGFAVALEDFDMGEKAREYDKETGPHQYYSQLNGFIPWLITKQLVKPEEYREIHLGSSGMFSDDFRVPRPK